MKPAVPRRPLNPLLLRQVNRSGARKSRVAASAGFPFYVTFFNILRSEKVIATDLTVDRLLRVADAVGFPRDEVFLDEAGR